MKNFEILSQDIPLLLARLQHISCAIAMDTDWHMQNNEETQESIEHMHVFIEQLRYFLGENK